MRRKGQAAMEFLMTYGWAILVVLLAIAALAQFGVLSPKVSDKAQFGAPLASIDTKAVLDTTNQYAEVALQNGNGVKIEIQTTGATTNVNTGTCNLNTFSIVVDGVESTTAVNISNGQKFLARWNCDGAPGDSGAAGETLDMAPVFAYKNTDTGQTFKHAGTIQGTWQ